MITPINYKRIVLIGVIALVLVCLLCFGGATLIRADASHNGSTWDTASDSATAAHSDTNPLGTLYAVEVLCPRRQLTHRVH